MKYLKEPTRNLFFTGKGGVGKTSLACATAIRLADAGKRVLLVSTDPASNLDELLGVELGPDPHQIPTVPRLFASNLDPEVAAAEYRERMVGPYRAVLPPAAVASIEEQFSGSCTLEIAAFDAFSRLLGDATSTAEFDHVVFDTAPTGHTLRLLTLPSAWSEFIDTNTTGTSCLGPLSGLKAQQQLYRQTASALGNEAMTTLVLVTRPDSAAFREAARASADLAALGVRNQHLVINGVFQATDFTDPIAVAMQQRGDAALAAIPETLCTLDRSLIPLQPNGASTVDSLRTLTAATTGVAGAGPWDVPTSSGGLAANVGSRLADFELLGVGSLIEGLAAPGRGVILTMGKGGVGKTTLAAAVALALAQRGLRVHLSTTDPAAHVAAMIPRAARSNLSVGRIDPSLETARYSAEVMQTAGAGLDAQGRALLAEDLRSPCTEEIAVFRAFAQAVAEGADRFVVLDTAPTGHTILLLDAALAHHREVLRQSSQMPKFVEQLLPRLRDPDFTRVLIVTLPEATPVHEAAMLQRDLRRAEIEPFAWVINQSLVPLAITDPVLRSRQRTEERYIREVVVEHANRATLIPWQRIAPVGHEALEQLLCEVPQLK